MNDPQLEYPSEQPCLNCLDHFSYILLFELMRHQNVHMAGSLFDCSSSSGLYIFPAKRKQFPQFDAHSVVDIRIVQEFCSYVQ